MTELTWRCENKNGRTPVKLIKHLHLEAKSNNVA